jgi:hypothetical protein
MKLSSVVKASAKTKIIAKTNEKIDFLSNFLRTVPKSEGKLAVALLLGENPYGRIGIGFAIKRIFTTNIFRQS